MFWLLVGLVAGAVLELKFQAYSEHLHPWVVKAYEWARARLSKSEPEEEVVKPEDPAKPE